MSRLRWAPGLTQQTVLLLLAVVLASLAITAIGFELQRRADFTDHRDDRARSLAALVHTARVMLLALPADRRGEVSATLATSGTLQVFPAREVTLPSGPPPGAAAAAPAGGSTAARAGASTTATAAHPAARASDHAPDPPDSPRNLAEALARYVAQPAEVHYRDSPTPQFWVKQDVHGEPWWIVVLAGRPPGPPPSPPWLALAVVLVLLVLAATIYATTITRPIGALADATRRVGEAWPEPVQPRGPAELRALARSFNAMLERLREVEKERRVLIAGLPHDLRAPLARLRLRVEMQPESAETPGMLADLASIERIVRQFNDYLRGESAAEGGTERLDVLLEDAAAPLRSLGTDVRVTNVEHGEREVPIASTRRILDNLVDNALLHGRQPVTVSATWNSADRLELAVTDAGPGIPAGARAAAVEPFAKLDPARGRGGCGLGLAIVRQLARRYDGDVAFADGPSSFTVRVQLRVPHVAPA